MWDWTEGIFISGSPQGVLSWYGTSYQDHPRGVISGYVNINNHDWFGRNCIYEDVPKIYELVLSISLHSSNPPRLMKSLVHSLLKTCYLKNKKHEYFCMMVKLLFKWLLYRCHVEEHLHELFLEAVTKLKTVDEPTVDKKKKWLKEKCCHESCIFFYIPIHPRDIYWKKIRRIYEQTYEVSSKEGNFKQMTNDETGNTMKIYWLTVPYSKPEILRDLLCPSALAKTEEIRVSKYVYKSILIFLFLNYL